MSGRLKVHGQGSVLARPDRYHLQFLLTRVEPTPHAALGEVSRRRAELEAIFTEAGVGAGARGSTGLWVHDEIEWDSEQRRNLHRGYRASARVSLDHGDAELAARLVSSATSRADARIEGPRWYLSSRHPARMEVCRRAATDARERAEAYAAALGLRLGALVKATDQPPPPQPVMMRAAMARTPSEPEPPEINLDPGEIEVTATMVATFALEPA
jgi:uncharacterized protein YggE